MKVSIVGVTGYSGLELVKLLSQHPQVELVSIHATRDVGKTLSSIYPYLLGVCDLPISAVDSDVIMAKADLVFLATPSGVANQLSAPFVAAGFPVIDLSGDHRLPADTYAEWYHKTPAKQEVIDQFVYGLSEAGIPEGSRFIANPGCYATATELALLPLVKAGVIDSQHMVVDAKSGLTGAGKALTETSHFVNVHDNYVTYKLNHHQHIPEIVQLLANYDETIDSLQFSTSLLPINRGIMATVYVPLKAPLSDADLFDLYQSCYQDKPFVRIQTDLPELHNVIGSNFCDIGFAYNPATNILTVIAVIDNLIKGAAGQAMQNLNLMFGLPEDLGFTKTPTYL